jgi:hypothetical protein
MEKGIFFTIEGRVLHSRGAKIIYNRSLKNKGVKE